MTLSKAYKITRKYKHRDGYYKPTIVTEIRLSKNLENYKGLYKPFVIQAIEEGTGNYFFQYGNKKLFNKTKATIKNEGRFEIKEINDYRAITSIGLVSEDDFYLAQDIMENLEKIPKKELVLNEVYMALNGKEYIYLDTLLRSVETGKEIAYKPILIYRELI